MAKSSRSGESRGRRPAARREAAQSQQSVSPDPTPATADDRAAATLATSVARMNKPTREEIAKRAYELFVARGGTHGYDIADWLQAEHELRGR